MPKGTYANRRRLSGKPAILELVVAAKFASARQLAEALGASDMFAQHFLHGRVVRNHPHLSRIAKALAVPVEQLVPLMKQKDMDDIQIKRLATRAANGSNGKPSKQKAVVLVKRGYNRLKREDADLRQSVRAVVTTINMCLMKGDTLMPAIPVEMMALVIEDYMKEKGTKGALVNRKFATMFD